MVEHLVPMRIANSTHAHASLVIYRKCSGVWCPVSGDILVTADPLKTQVCSYQNALRLQYAPEQPNQRNQTQQEIWNLCVSPAPIHPRIFLCLCTMKVMWVFIETSIAELNPVKLSGPILLSALCQDFDFTLRSRTCLGGCLLINTDSVVADSTACHSYRQPPVLSSSSIKHETK